MNKYVFAYRFSVLWDIYLGMDSLAYMVFYVEFFEELPDLFSWWLSHLKFPRAVGSNFSTSSSIPINFCHDDHDEDDPESHLSGYKMVSDCGFDWHFLSDS